MSDRPNRRVLVAPANKESQIAGLGKSPNGVTLGTPAREAEGVPNRRIAYSHAYADVDVAWMLDRISDAAVLDALPADWRWTA